jgi:hypothetical protein
LEVLLKPGGPYCRLSPSLPPSVGSDVITSGTKPAVFVRFRV